MSGAAKTNLPFLTAVLALLVFILVYMHFFTPSKERIDGLKKENASLETEVADLKEKVSYQGYYEVEADRMRSGIRNIYSLFPADVKIEDAIFTAIRLDETSPKAQVSNIGFTPSADVYTVGEGEAAEAPAPEPAAEEETTLEEDVATAAEGGATIYPEGSGPVAEPISLGSGYQGEYGEITLRNAVTTLNFATTYSGVKKLVDFFTNASDRSTIAQISLGFDSNTGMLNGSVSVNCYSLTGTGREYVEPPFLVTEIGNSNIFSTVELAGGGYSVDMGSLPSMDMGEPIMGEEFSDMEGEEPAPEEGLPPEAMEGVG